MPVLNFAATNRVYIGGTRARLIYHGSGIVYQELVEQSGARAWTIADAPNVSQHIDVSISSSVTLSGGLASQVDDLSGNGAHLQQSDPGRQPSLVVGGINGLDALYFNSDYMDIATGEFELSDNAYMLVAQPVSAGGTHQFFSGISARKQTRAMSARLEIAGSANLWGPSVQQAARGSGLTWQTGQTHIVYFAGSDPSDMRLDTVAGTTYPRAATSPPFLIGRLGARQGAVSCNYRLGAIVRFAGVPSGDIRQRTEAVLAAQWGVALPVGHPYRDAPPMVPD